MAHGGIVADMVRNALRRKLAAAQAAGDQERIDRLRGMMNLPADAPEIHEPPTHQVVDITPDLGTLWVDVPETIRDEVEGTDE